MNFIIEEDCYNLDVVNSMNPIMTPFLYQVLNTCNISSLDYFVIADSDDQNYSQTVLKYASLVGTDTHVTQNGVYYAAGKSLDGIDINGKLHQAIVIKSSVWVCAAIEYGTTQGLFNEDIWMRISRITSFSPKRNGSP